MGKLASLPSAQPTRSKGGVCAIQALMATLDADDAAVLRDRVDRPDEFEATWLSRQLRDVGVELGYWVINRHRRGDCKCPR